MADVEPISARDQPLSLEKRLVIGSSFVDGRGDVFDVEDLTEEVITRSIRKPICIRSTLLRCWRLPADQA